MFVVHESRWVDVSLRNLTGDWLRRVEERFASVNGVAPRCRGLGVLPRHLVAPWPEACVVHSRSRRDVRGLALGRGRYRSGLRPRPAACLHPPRPDGRQTLEGQGRAHQGPARRHPQQAQRLLESTYGRDLSKVLAADYLGAPSVAPPAVPCIKRTDGKNEATYEFVDRLLKTSVWLETFAGPELGWLRALTTSTTVVQGTSYIDNPSSACWLRAPARRPSLVTTRASPSPSRSTAPRVRDDQSLPEIDIRETFVGPEVTIESAAVEEFHAVVGNQDESFLAARNEVSVPMDFAIVTGWQAIMKSIFPASIDGDLLRLVHLSNGFRMVPGEKPLRAGDVSQAEAKIVSVSNTDSGKVVKVKGHVFRAGKPVIEVVSAFLYRGRFTNSENTFETTEEPDYVLKLENDAAVGVLQSKDNRWVELDRRLTASLAVWTDAQYW
uniref:MaoC-like domain-containing protein n=1 Tax=Mycena chlorophos TaxID=658473 RepID=A0ABQ0KY48_MYCCL|nr:predicted protein [Mycena chlorophos]